MKYPCSNTQCENMTDEPNTLCDDCKRRERLTETPENRDRAERAKRWERHKANRKGKQE